MWMDLEAGKRGLPGPTRGDETGGGIFWNAISC